MQIKLKDRKGRYDRSKYKILTMLDLHAWQKEYYIGCRRLVLETGIPYRSLQTLLKRWCGWGYVKRRRALNGQGEFEYRILHDGRDWLEYARQNLPNAKIFNYELALWQKIVYPRKEQLDKMKFNDFLKEIYSV